jgi:proton-dependent oligopeptide transporter, POT family
MDPDAPAAPAAPTPFPRVFWVALGLELLERAAFYGVYVNLAVYLTGTVRLTDVENGSLLGVFALVRSWVPVGTGALADRIGFRRSLFIAFSLYIAAYLTLFAAPSRAGAWAAVMGMAIGGAFLKPVIPATVRRHAPEDRRPMGFSLFYASVNAGSVVGKVLTKIIRTLISLRASMINAVVACVLALVVTIAAYREPAGKGSAAVDKGSASAPAALASNPIADVVHAFSQGKLILFLVLVSGYYLLIEQFYQTFPVYIVRSFGEEAPREYITLINPAAIAILQVGVGRLTKRLPPLPAMAFGVLVAAGSMLLMGAVPTLVGACLSFFVFALAEMILSPRYYEYISSFAPKGREGLYMGLAIAPLGIGGLVGGVLSGRLIARFIPREGPRDPLAVWGTYAAIGVGCSALLAVYAIFVTRRRAPLVESTS